MSRTAKILLSIFLFPSFVAITASSVVFLYEKRTLIQNAFSRAVSEQINFNTLELNTEWAKKILNGGYILHFRHAERDKWIDVQAYDALESDVHDNGKDESRYAENDYFEQAVCLNSRGKIQAKAIGEHFEHIGVPIGYVASSVSCRARQTADLAFGGFDSQHRVLVHTGPYNENVNDRSKILADFYQNLPFEDGKNTIVSAHNSVIRCGMFVNDRCPSKLSLEEGGFYVFSRTEQGLRFEHEFHSFVAFMRTFYER